MHIFYEIHEALPREAPGDEASTLRAWRALRGLPASPSVLDIGCGPGMQTVALVRASGAVVTALDIHRPFLNELVSRSIKACAAPRVHAVQAYMDALPFAGPFDVIWAEGSIYIIGFADGLRRWRRLLKPGGWLAATELSWIKPEPPREIAEYWQGEYPGMATAEQNVAAANAAGYSVAERFTLPESAWWEPYYRPMEDRVAELRVKYRGDESAQRLLDVRSREVEMYRKYSAWYGYVFYVMQRD